MEPPRDDQNSFPEHLARSREAAVELQSTENGQEANLASSTPKIGHPVSKDLPWSSNSTKALGQEDTHDLIVKQPRFSWFQKYVTFYRLHATYFLMLGSFGALGMYMLPLSGSGRMSFVDATYTSFSAVCGTGLQTVRSGELTQFHNLLILLLMNLGAPVLVSLLPLYVRRFYFHLCIKQFRRDSHGDQGKDSALSKDVKLRQNYDHEELGLEPKHIEPPYSCDEEHPQDGTVGVLSIDSDDRDLDDGGDHSPTSSDIYMEDLGGIRRVFVDAKQSLRTLEYKALRALSWVVTTFFIASQIIGFSLGALYFLVSPGDANITRRMDINPTYYAFYTAISSFTNGGYNLNNDSMLTFRKSSFLLIVYTVLASLGNTMYAPFLRLLVWMCYHLVGEKDKAVYEYLLCHPRRCFTNMFPRSQTVWLVVVFAAFTSLQLIFLCKFEWNQALGGMTTLEKLTAGVYQSVGTRNAGGEVVSLYRIEPAILFLFMVMMYISAYPNFLSLQTSSDDYNDAELQVRDAYKKTISPEQYESIVVVQCRRLLARDASHLFFAILSLCISEKVSIKEDPLNFSIFNIVFEIVSLVVRRRERRVVTVLRPEKTELKPFDVNRSNSIKRLYAYGSSGLSLGYHCDLQIDEASPCDNVPYSFSGRWTSTGKLIMVLIMFLGRHRGLPDNIDSAIRLPTTTMPQATQRRCEEYVTEVELRMRPQLELPRRISPDFIRQWTAVESVIKIHDNVET